MQTVDFLRMLQLPARGIQIFFALNSIGVTGYLMTNSYGYGPQLPFNIFVSVITIVTAALLSITQLLLKKFSNVYLTFLVEAIIFIFWWVDWAWYVAGFVQAAVCRFCDYQRAEIAFAAMEWFVYGFTVVVAIIDIIHHRRHPVIAPMQNAPVHYAPPPPQPVPAPEMRPATTADV